MNSKILALLLAFGYLFVGCAFDLMGIKVPRGSNRRDLFHDKMFTWVGNNDIVNFRLENAKLVGTLMFGKKPGYSGYKFEQFTLVAWFTDVEGVIIAKASYSWEDREVDMGEELKFVMDMPEGYKKFVYVVFGKTTDGFTPISDQTKRFEEVADPSVRIDIRGASVLPPQEKGWKIVQKNDNQLSLNKGTPQSDATYAAIVMINELPEIESEEQFSEFSKKLLSNYPTERMTIKKEEGEISYSRETYCWRYHLIFEDRGAKKRSGKKVMLLEGIGYICQHPKVRKKGINFGYWHGYYPGDDDPEIENKANEFLDNVTFTDFISESVELDSINPVTYYERGIAHLLKNQNDKAIDDFNQAITLNPRYAEAYKSRGDAYFEKYFEKGQTDKACPDWERACELGLCASYERAKYKGYCE